METSAADITRLLAAGGDGDKAAPEELVPVVHKELRRLAVRSRDLAHFFAMSAQLMCRVLVGSARSRRSVQRGGQAIRVTFEKALEARFFGGFSVEETADVPKVSTGTIHRDWRFAKIWLRRELGWVQQP